MSLLAGHVKVLPRQLQSSLKAGKSPSRLLLEAFFRNLESIDDEIKLYTSQVLDQKGDLYEGVCLRILGVDRYQLSDKLSRRLVRVFPDYIRQKGTILGFHKISRAMFGSSSVYIDERSYPYSPIRLGEVRVGMDDNRLSSHDDPSRSVKLCVPKGVYKRNRENVSEIKAFLGSQLEPGLRLYLSTPPKPDARSRTARARRLGDRLL